MNPAAGLSKEHARHEARSGQASRVQARRRVGRELRRGLRSCLDGVPFGWAVEYPL